MKPASDLAHLFRPKTVAIFGSFKQGFFGGYTVVKQLISFGFPGKIYPINPRYNEVFDLKVYPSLKEVSEAVDLAMIMTNASAVPQIMLECAEKGVKAAIIVSDGFAERDKEGAKLQRAIVDIARRTGMRIVGPNTVGMMNTIDSTILCAYECWYEKVKKGAIALVGQTGIIGPQAMPWHEFSCGINKVVDLGNKCDVNESDVLEYLGNDSTIKVIALHLEDIKDGQRFLRIAKQVIKKKPVLVLKVGRTKEGAKALASHTGSLAGDDQVFDSLCKQAGIIRVDRWNELLNFAKILAHQPLPKGNRVGIVSVTGGGAAIMIDMAAQCGLAMASLSAQSSKRLAELYPPAWGANPIDLGPPAPYYGPETWFSLCQETLDILLNDDNVDCVAMVIAADPFGASLQVNAKMVERLIGNLSKPIAIWTYGPSLSHVAELSRGLENLGFPVYLEPETAVKALGVMYKYACAV
jgi:acyl-CoA synthetase (NDP forming)